MSGEAKTVSELCREALELRELAPGQFESIKGHNRLLLDNDPRYFGWNMGEEYEVDEEIRAIKRRGKE